MQSGHAAQCAACPDCTGLAWLLAVRSGSWTQSRRGVRLSSLDSSRLTSLDPRAQIQPRAIAFSTGKAPGHFSVAAVRGSTPASGREDPRGRLGRHDRPSDAIYRLQQHVRKWQVVFRGRGSIGAAAHRENSMPHSNRSTVISFPQK